MFWNVSADALDLERSQSLIMAAVLGRGEFADVQWLFQTYGRQRISEFVRADIAGRRQLPRGARKLWAAILCPDIPRPELEDRPGEDWRSTIQTPTRPGE
jgi:hypothetical protein